MIIPEDLNTSILPITHHYDIFSNRNLDIIHVEDIYLSMLKYELELAKVSYYRQYTV